MARLSIRRRGGRLSGVAGRFLLTLFGVVFLALGSVATWLLGVRVVDNLAVWGWQETTCTVTASNVGVAPLAGDGGDAAAEGRDVGFTVSYVYRADGAERSGHRVRPKLGDDPEDPETAYGLADRYPVGAEVPCRVDPDDPTAAYLETPSPWQALSLVLTLLFVAVGAGVLAIAWWPAGGDVRPRPVTAGDRRPGHGAGCLAAFFALFLVVGLAIFIPFFALPALDTLAARSWPTAPATVVDSRVVTHAGDDGATFSVEVLYRYQVGGRAYHSNRYDFVTGSSSGWAAKQAIVERYPPGHETTCRYDPERPSRAVLSTDFRGEWWFALLPLVFVAVGAVGTIGALTAGRRARRRAAAGRREWLPAGEEGEAGGGALVLEAGIGPWGKLFGLLAVTLFWNGIVGVFVWHWWTGWKAGSVDGCLTLFLLPFVLVGLLLVASLPYQLLAGFNPRPVVTLDRHRLAIGEEATLRWSFRGSGGRIRRLRITLGGREEATYTRGTDRVTVRETFAEIVVFDGDFGVATGGARFQVPADGMHSFEATHNKIVWQLVLHGTIDRWPDVHEELPLVVYPRRLA